MERMHLIVIALGVFAEVMIFVSFVNTVKDFERDFDRKSIKSLNVVEKKTNKSFSFFDNISRTESFLTKFLATTLKSLF